MSTVSIVVVNYKGTSDTITCLESLRELDWPRDELEVVVVDNGSGDGGAEVLAARFPDATLVALDENLGFAGGCNRGAAAASGTYVAFLNNDARPDPAWLRAAVDVLDADSSVACVASKILDWDGEHVDFVDAALSFYGHGFKLHVGEPDRPEFDRASDVLFASGAATVMRRDVFEAVGGFDDRYFMFFEDVDLGWRLWMLGHRVRYVPESLVFHRHHRSMEGIAPWREHYLLERNALFTIVKNYDDENLRRALPGALLLAVRRANALGGADTHALDLARGAGDPSDRMDVSSETMAPIFAVDALVEELPSLLESRAALQSSRRRGDHEIVRSFRLPYRPNHDLRALSEAIGPIMELCGVKAIFGERHRVLVATGDTLGAAMAGPAIRAWQIARVLSREHEVVLASTVQASIEHPDFRVVAVDDRELAELMEWCDVVIFQGYLMHQHGSLKRPDKVVVADIYDPFHLEQLEQARDLGEEVRQDVVGAATQVINEQLGRGDLFLCASEKQRDFWLGQLAAVGRLNPVSYDADESMDALVKIVPFGVDDEPPEHTRAVLRGVVDGIGDHDKVVLWGGGIYNWLDPLTLISAIDKLKARVPTVRLYVLGTAHPNPHVPVMRMEREARRLASDLGLTGTHVFFNDGWVDYEDRQNYLTEADVGVSCHLEHVETEFSFRTRILDYLWAGLPVVATDGDSFGELIRREGLGAVVPAGDVDALEVALFELLDDDQRRAACGAAAARVAEALRWSKALEPLVEFCRAPRRAPDLLDPSLSARFGHALSPLPSRGWAREMEGLRRVARSVRAGDWRGVAVKARNRARRALRGG